MQTSSPRGASFSRKARLTKTVAALATASALLLAPLVVAGPAFADSDSSTSTTSTTSNETQQTTNDTESSTPTTDSSTTTSSTTNSSSTTSSTTTNNESTSGSNTQSNTNTLPTNNENTPVVPVNRPAPVWKPYSYPDMEVGVAYSADKKYRPSGYQEADYKFYVVDGALPDGIVLKRASGALSGTPTTAGEYNFTLSAVDGDLYVEQEFTVSVEINDPVWTDSSLGDLTEGVYASDGISASNQVNTYYLAEGSDLPAGLYLDDATGAITGTPEEEGEYSFDVIAENYSGETETTVSGSIASGDPVWEDTSLGDLTEGIYYDGGVWAANAQWYYLAEGSELPAGLNLDCGFNRSSDCDATISGTPQEEGPYSFDIIAANEYGETQVTISGTVASSDPTWVDTTLGAMYVGVGFNDTVVASSPVDTYIEYWVVDGELPAGLHLGCELSRSNDCDGTITGTPEVAGLYSFTIGAYNGYGEIFFDFTVSVLGADAHLSLDAPAGTVAGDSDVFGSAHGLLPGSDYVVTLHSTPVVLSQGQVPANGELALNMKLPAGIEDGAHRIVLDGTTGAGNAVSSEVWFSVLNGKIVEISYEGPVADPRKAALAYTGGGSSSGIQLMIVLGLIGAGSALLLGRRRQAADLGL